MKLKIENRFLYERCMEVSDKYNALKDIPHEVTRQKPTHAQLLTYLSRLFKFSERTIQNYLDWVRDNPDVTLDMIEELHNRAA